MVGPGGMLELGETLRDGVRREALEETGVAVEPGRCSDVFDSIFTDALGRTQYHYVLIDYLCRPLGRRSSAGSDVSDVRWVRHGGVFGYGICASRSNKWFAKDCHGLGKLPVDSHRIYSDHFVSDGGLMERRMSQSRLVS